MESAIIVDLDGTLCLFDGNPYDRNFSKDRVNKQVQDVIFAYKLYKNVKIIFLSGRNDKFEKVTRSWIENNLIGMNYQLYMRKDKDFRKDVIIKEELYNNYVKDKYSVDFVIDDRLQVCKLWYKLGLFVFNVNQGLKEF